MRAAEESRVLILGQQRPVGSGLSEIVSGFWPRTEIVRVDICDAAQRLVRRHGFDVVFVDMRTPVQSELATIKRLREGSLADGTPIVLCIEGESESEFANRCGASIDYIISRPFCVDEVSDILEDVQRNARAKTEVSPDWASIGEDLSASGFRVSDLDFRAVRELIEVFEIKYWSLIVLPRLSEPIF